MTEAPQLDQPQTLRVVNGMLYVIDRPYRNGKWEEVVTEVYELRPVKKDTEERAE